MNTPLRERIAALIRHDGPMTIADYVAHCLADPHDGYYMRGDPFGKAGDFVTAPEVSQMFGELIGAWCLACWQSIGAPSAFHLVELGPGRGTLMADLLRMASIRPAFLDAASLHLVETSPSLRACQADTLARAPLAPQWHDHIDALPYGPLIVVANEFFDALPIRQYLRTEAGWRERVVGVDDSGGFAFGLGPGVLPDADIPADCRAAPVGAVLETRPAATAIMTTLAGRIFEHGGAVLTVDYGHANTAVGDTLQAMRGHQFADPLADPGAADLTAHVDFAALARAAKAAGARPHPLLTQAEFLVRLGLIERAGRLGAGRDGTVQNDIRATVDRLAGPDEMGDLFKVLAVTRPDVTPEPFDS